MMKKRIDIKRQKDKLELTILAFKDEQKQKMLLYWIILFSLCGIAIITQFFQNYDAKTKLFFGIYMAFWLFFEFKVIYAYRWRSLGLEKLTIENNNLLLTKQINKRGVTQQYSIDEISNIRLLEDTGSDFFQFLTNSYWNVNNYTMAFDVINQPIPFAIDLSEKEAKGLLKEMKSYFAN